MNLAEAMSGVGRWRVDLPGNLVTWSAEVYRIHGVDPADFDPQFDDAVGFFHEEDRAAVLRCVERAVAYQEPYSFQLRLTRADGQLRHVTCKAECELRDDGTTRAVVGVFQDITEHVTALRSAEQARELAIEEARRAAVAEEIAGLGRWRVDYQSRALSWTPPMYAIYGLDPSTPLDIEAVMAMTHPDDLAMTQARLERDLAGESMDERPVIRIIRPDGEVRWAIGHTTVEKDSAGAVVALIGTLMDITVQTLTDREIAQSEARYRLLTENSHDLIVKISREGLLQYVSPSIFPLLGYLPKELLGRTAEDLVYPPDLKSCRAAFNAAALGQSVERRDYRLVHKDGSVVWIDARPQVLRDPATGEIVGVTDSIRDVTARRAAEMALAEGEARFRLLADNASDIVTQSDLDGRFSYVSPAVHALTGYRPEEVVGSLAIDFVHPDDRDRVVHEIAASLSTLNAPQIEHRHIRKDGRVIWVESRPTLARDPESGKPFAVTDVLRDITARKTAEAALAATEMRYRYLADNASDLISRCDREGTVLYLSPSVEAILGYTPGELVGGTTLRIIHPEDRASVVSSFELYLKSGPKAAPPRIEYRAIHKDGTILWFEAHPRALYDSEGRAFEFMDIVRDVTARKAMEQALQIARADAEAATAVKSDFMSNMSHELRTPLTSILGFSAMLDEERGLTEQGRRAVDRVLGSSQALLTIVNDILDFSKLESGQVEIDRRAVDPRSVLSDALGLLDPQAAAKGLTLTITGEDALPPYLMMDDGRVRQILLNLTSNGVKFTETGGVELNVSYDAAKERLRCAVIDTGPGIPPDRLDRLFKRFSQVDASTTRAFGGTGLGLAICKGLVEAMGGEIGVDSELGKGASFWFDLPASPADRPVEIDTEADDGGLGVLHGLRLLVADDNPINRELIRVLLTSHGVEIAEAANGDAAIRLAEEQPFDVIMMDIRMPGRDGPAAARIIRQGGGPNDVTPILAFTANAAEDLPIAETAGLFDGYVGKPISPADLLATMASWAIPSISASPVEVSHG